MDLKVTQSGYVPSIIVLLLVLSAVSVAAEPVVDGLAAEGEYERFRSYASGEVEIGWTRIGDTVQMYLAAPTTGWVAIGFDPIVVMDNADMLLFAVTEDGVLARDARSLGAYGPFPPDTSRNGTNDLSVWAGNESEGRTTVEFRRPIETDDPHDVTLRFKGTHKIVWAYGRSDAFDTRYEVFGIGYLPR